MNTAALQQASSVFAWMQMPMIAVGLVGNLLTFLVFSREKFRNNSIGIYIRALAISDSFTVYRLVYNICQYFFNIRLNVLSNFMCKFYYFMTISLTSISIWTLVAFSVDKMIHVLGKSQKFPFMNKKSFQLAVVIANALVHVVIYSFIPILVELKQIPGFNGTTIPFCFLQTIPNYKYINMFDLIEADFLPFVVLMITTCITVRCLFKSRNNLEATQQRSLRERRAKDVKFAINSIALNVLAVTFNTPISIAYLITIPNAAVFGLFFSICAFLYTVNYSILFFVNLAFNSIFRNELFLMLRLRKTRINPSSFSATPQTFNVNQI
jgi:hypothetical protein